MYSVLIVDDEYQIIQGLKQLINWKSLGFEITDEALNATDALLKANQQHFDVIICDIRMPGMDGLDMIEYLRNSGSRAKIILLSGYKEFEYAKRAIDYDVFSYIVKPINEVELIKVLKALNTELNHESEKTSTRTEDQTNKQVVLERTSSVHLLVEDLCSNIKNGLMDEIGKSMDSIFNTFDEMDYYSNGPFHLVSSEILIKVTSLLGELGSNILSVSGENIAQYDFDDISYESMKEKLKNICIKSTHYIYEQNLAASNEIVVNIIKYIKENLNTDLSLKNISKLYFMNQFYLGRLFRKITGMTFNDYISKCRIEKAVELLKKTDIKVYEVCEKVGFSDINYFCKVFKRYKEVTPSEYKRQLMLKEQKESSSSY